MDVLRKLRRNPVPILILTARDDERSVVPGLRSGADDYLVKPVKLVELLAVIEAVTRRTNRAGQAAPHSIVVGNVSVDLDRRKAAVGERELSLTATEFEPQPPGKARRIRSDKGTDPRCPLG